MHRLNNIIDDSWASVLKVGIYTLFGFLNINIDVVHILCWLIIIDIASGFIKTVVIRSLKFTFRKLYIGLLSKLIIILIPMTMALVALGLGYDFRMIIDFVLKLLIVSEGISIYTNFISVKRREVIKNKDYVHLLLVFIRKMLIRIFNSIQKELSNENKK